MARRQGALVAEKQQEGAELTKDFGEKFFDDESAENLVDEVLREKDETLRQIYDENEQLRAQILEYQETVRRQPRNTPVCHAPRAFAPCPGCPEQYTNERASDQRRWRWWWRHFRWR
jgi:hypothetical protein|eukprot:SAG25_NODE_6221_length_577_cov_1.405858_1_plen_117_part_00